MSIELLYDQSMEYPIHPAHLKRDHIAKWTSRALDPSVWWPIVLVAMIFNTGLSAHQVKLLLPIMLCVELALPVIFLIWSLKTKRISDWEMTRIEERRDFFLFVVLVHAISLVLLAALANEELFNLRLILYIIEVFGTYITFFWKISAHAAVNTTGVLILVHLFGWWLWPLFLLVPVVAWSRWEQEKHTPLQLLGGTFLTLGYLLFTFWLFGWL